MTAAVVRDYRVKGEEGAIDIPGTMGFLGEAEKLLEIIDV